MKGPTLTEPQAQLLRDLNASEFGELHLRGARLRTGRQLVAKGLAHPYGRWIKVSETGREHPAAQPPSKTTPDNQRRR